MSIQIQSEGQRVYVVGDTYAVRSQIKALGAHWDGERKAWWLGAAKRAAAEALVASLAAAPAAPAPYAPAADEAMVRVDGNTYPVREQLRQLGGRWDGMAKVWMVPASQAEAARAAVTAAGPAKPRTGGGVYDAQKFNGYGRPRGGYRRACPTGGNCSSVGSGRSCGAYDCDGY